MSELAIRDRINVYSLNGRRTVKERLEEEAVEDTLRILMEAWRSSHNGRAGKRAERELTFLALALHDSGVIVMESPFGGAS